MQIFTYCPECGDDIDLGESEAYDNTYEIEVTCPHCGYKFTCGEKFAETQA